MEVGDIGIVGREAAEGQRRERVADRIEQRHARRPKAQCAGGREDRVDGAQRARGLGDARRKLGVLDRAGTASPMMPMPPSQLNAWRHMLIECGSWSMPLSCVAPVVDSPDMVSK